MSSIRNVTCYVMFNIFYAAATSMKWIEAKMKVRTLFLLLRF